MGEEKRAGRERLFGLTFNRAIKVEARAERLSSDAGVLLQRELDERLELTRTLAAALHDPRDPELVTHLLEELLRSRLYLINEGWRDQDDVDKLRHDPALRLAVSERRGDAALRPATGPQTPDGLASQPTQSRLTTALSTAHNRKVLQNALLDWTQRGLRARRQHRYQHVTVDFDSTMFEVYGSQGGSAYNGYYKCRGYHPLLAQVAETGDWVGGQLRSGEVWTAAGAVEFVLPILARVEAEIGQVALLRGDAGMVSEPMLVALEQRRNTPDHRAETPYVFRLKTNAVLDRMAEPYLHRPPGRPPLEGREWLHELQYQAGSWSVPRRVVLVVIERPYELFVDSFFLVTNLTAQQLDGAGLLENYRPRGTMEHCLGELKTALAPALSCSERQGVRKRSEAERQQADARDSACNEATLLVYLLAYNLANQLRLMMEDAAPQAIPATSGHQLKPERKPLADYLVPRCGWSLQRFREQVLKVAARFVLGGREVVVVLPERRRNSGSCSGAASRVCNRACNRASLETQTTEAVRADLCGFGERGWCMRRPLKHTVGSRRREGGYFAERSVNKTGS